MKDKKIDITIFIEENDYCAVYLNQKLIAGKPPTSNARILFMGDAKLKEILKVLGAKNGE